MATTKETMKVIANGIKKTKSPEPLLEGKVIRVDLPEEAAEVLAEIFSIIKGFEETNDESTEEESKSKAVEQQVKKGIDLQSNGEGGSDNDYDREPTEIEDLVDRIVTWVAYRAVDHLMKIAENLTTEAMLAIVKCIEQMETEGQIILLKVLFLSCGMNDAVEELRLLDICMEYDQDAAYYFENAFFDTNEIDWYSIGNLILNKTGNKSELLN